MLVQLNTVKISELVHQNCFNAFKISLNDLNVGFVTIFISSMAEGWPKESGAMFTILLLLSIIVFEHQVPQQKLKIFVIGLQN